MLQRESTGEASGLRVTLMRNRGGILMPCGLPLVETAPLKAPQPRRELSWAPGAEGETRLGLLFARRAPRRPACRSGLSEHEFSEPEKLVGQKATPGGGHDHREAKADQQQKFDTRVPGGTVSVAVTPTSLVPYLRRPRTHQARLRPRKM